MDNKIYIQFFIAFLKRKKAWNKYKNNIKHNHFNISNLKKNLNDCVPKHFVIGMFDWKDKDMFYWNNIHEGWLKELENSKNIIREEKLKRIIIKNKLS